MLRIPFTTEDLAKVSFQRFDPWTETLLSIRVLHSRRPGGGFTGWRRKVAKELARQGLDSRLRALSTLAQGEPFLLDADQVPSREARDALAAYRRIAVDPYRRRMAALIDGELHLRSHLTMRGGHAESLEGLGSHTRWSGSVLEARCPESHEVHLTGRGLLVLPSFFCPQDHVVLTGPKERPTLVYPVRQASGAAELEADGEPRHDLAALLGATRATVLEVIAEDCSTTELADRLHISLASASQHAAVLRDTGLIVTQRCGRSVQHALTPLGRQLLVGGGGPGAGGRADTAAP